jgi:hypothetical protein
MSAWGSVSVKDNWWVLLWLSRESHVEYWTRSTRTSLITPFPHLHAPLPLDSSPFLRSTNQHHQIQLTTHSLAYIWLPKTPNLYTFTLKMANAMLVETLDNSEHSTRLIPESQSYTLNSSCENQRTRIGEFVDQLNLFQPNTALWIIVLCLKMKTVNRNAEPMLK